MYYSQRLGGYKLREIQKHFNSGSIGTISNAIHDAKNKVSEGLYKKEIKQLEKLLKT